MSGIRDSAVANGSAVGAGGIGVGPFDVVAGDSICVQVCDPNPNITVEDDNGGGTSDYVEVGTFQEATPNVNRVRLWVLKNAPSGSVTVTVKFTSGSGDPTCIAASAEGVTTDPVDTGSEAKVADGSSPFEVTSAGQVQADNLMVLTVCSGETSHNSYVGNNGFTMVQEGTDDGLYWPGAFLVKDVSQTSAVTGGFTNSGASNTGLKIVALKEIVGPTIDSEPADVATWEGATAQFAVDATASAGSLTYQWQVDTGGGFSNVSQGSGGTTDTYTTQALAVSDSGALYRCQVTDDNGTTNTRSARLTVLYAGKPFYLKA